MVKRKITLGVIIGLLGAFALAGTALAQERPADGTTHDSVNDRIAEILGIDRETLDFAMETARKEYREAKQDKRLAVMVEAGTITQEQADEIDVWKDTKPEVMDGLKKLAREYGGVRSNLEATLNILVEQQAITQAEANEIIAWKDARPAYLDELREEFKGERDVKGPRSRQGQKWHRRSHSNGPSSQN
jgi:hypothetical protein